MGQNPFFVAINVISNNDGNILASLNVDKLISLDNFRIKLEEIIFGIDWFFMDERFEIPVKYENKCTCQEILKTPTNQVLIKTLSKTTETEIYKDNILMKRLDLDLS